MTGKEFQTWIIWTMRILTPIFAIASFMMYLVQSFFFSILNGVGVTVTFLMIKIIPILCIPVYVICKIYKSSGSILNRIRFLCRPNDWYPADPVEHQNYETYLGNSDMSNELVHDDGNTYF
ncbi:uncharacterized protein LOC129608491 [Condylostylus longicornis]|uniref:uncharacterized protein LOC129608491 n=1 Tax=Condylostylus longicornis TaxID=2530218 RepID=UPI00244DD7B9|nr:uncharacterized protein LOC129608491 [Condylostylus longicornis]